MVSIMVFDLVPHRLELWDVSILLHKRPCVKLEIYQKKKRFSNVVVDVDINIVCQTMLNSLDKKEKTNFPWIFL